MTAILDSLKYEHSMFRRYLDLFDGEMDRFESGRTPDYELLEALLDYFLSFPDEWHHQKEDLVYDALSKRSASMKGRLSDLRAEHVRLEEGVRKFGQHIAQLRLGSDLPMTTIVTAGRRYSQLLRRHMLKEDDVFFPLADECLTEADWEVIRNHVETAETDTDQSARLTAIADIAERIEEIEVE